MSYRDELEAALLRAEEAEKRAAKAEAELAEYKKNAELLFREDNKLSPPGIIATTKDLLGLHLGHINNPPGGVRFTTLRNGLRCTLLLSSDSLAMAYSVSRTIFGRIKVVAVCVGQREMHSMDKGWHPVWVERKGTRQVFKGEPAKKIKLALQALHVMTRK